MSTRKRTRFVSSPPLLLGERPSWHDHALCLGRLDLCNMFYEEQPDHGYYRSEGALIKNARARAFCDVCPVAISCLEESIARRDWFGVRGGVYGSLRKRWAEEGLSPLRMLQKIRQPYPKRLLAKAVGSVLEASLGAAPSPIAVRDRGKA